MNIETRFPIMPGGCNYDAAMTIVDGIAAGGHKNNTYAVVRAGYLSVITTNNNPINPDTFAWIVDVLTRTD